MKLMVEVAVKNAAVAVAVAVSRKRDGGAANGANDASGEILKTLDADAGSQTPLGVAGAEYSMRASKSVANAPTHQRHHGHSHHPLN